jgi:hypothetical protein
VSNLALDDKPSEYVMAAADLGGNQSPTSLKEAQESPDWAEWHKAMIRELQTLHRKGTYIPSKLPHGRKPVKSKWVFKLKPSQGENPPIYKARLVAQGFTQVAGIDYDDTHAPSLRLESFRLFLAIAASLDLEIRGMDVVGAYLNGELDREIYMTQPPGFSDGTDDVLLLKKTLYGLKQSGHAWREVCEGRLKNMGFKPLGTHKSLFIWRVGDLVELAAVHVDDFAVAIHKSRVEIIEEEISKAFEINLLGDLSAMIGFDIERDRAKRVIYLSQKDYANKIVDHVGLTHANTAATPLDTHVKLTPLPSGESDPSMAQTPYQLAIGSLMYLAMGTRFDISYAVQHLSQFSSNPSQTHWTAVKRVFRYIKGTADYRLTLGGISSDSRLEGYSDADWAADLADRRSISGFVFTLGGPISWSSKKQATVSLSSMEAEYMAMTHATREAIWLRALLTEIGVPQHAPTVLHVDNQAALAFSQNRDFHMRTKHIAIRHYFCRDAVKNGDIAPQYIHTDRNLADLFTKALPAPRHRALVSQLGLAPGAEGES